MEKFKNALNILLTILVIVVLYFVVSGSNKLKETQDTIKQVKTELLVVKDSLNKTQETLSLVIGKLNFTENELKLLKTERELLELEEQQKIAKDWDQLQKLKLKIAKKEASRIELKEKAEKFEL